MEMDILVFQTAKNGKGKLYDAWYTITPWSPYTAQPMHTAYRCQNFNPIVHV